MKKLLLSSLPFLAILASCGGPSSSSSGTDKGSSITNPWWSTTGELEKKDGEIVYDEINITLATVVAGEDVASFNNVVKIFNNEYKGRITVNVENIGQDTYEKTVSDRISQNQDAPDMLMSHIKGHATFAKNHIIQPIDEVLEKTGINYSKVDVINTLASYSDLGYDGYTFDVPVDAQSQILVYNKQLLKKYNNGVLPSSREEFIEVCKKAKQGEGSGFVPFAVPTSGTSFFQWYFVRTALAQNGFNFFNEDTYKVDWASNADNLAALQAAVKSVNSMFYGENAIANPNLSYTTGLSTFTSNKALFFAYDPWMIESLVAKYGTDNGGKTSAEVMDNYIGGASIATIFQEDGANPNAYKIYGDSHGLALSNSVTDITKKAACVEFMNFLNKNVDAGVEWARGGHVSASQLIRNDAAYKSDSYIQNFTEGFYTDLNEFVSAGVTPFYETTFGELDSMMASLFKNNVSDADVSSKARSSEDSVNLAIDFGS